ncbi:CotH kinase family protein [Clostridium formicaceticum]|uniref:Inner spore coat protein H n=1 Tax=Clostridium formicaceticum TaxID=1497 RepID=A0AAC9RH86_9CLOT|nr:CotH kinase family protein [Clostridium formicaceticum]AOY76505.1 spore coat protein CotH [Clostridium formicaceticum]ARE86914.1 Inner spore coat protein H [Clostridium formicaceticum]
MNKLNMLKTITAVGLSGILLFVSITVFETHATDLSTLTQLLFATELETAADYEAIFNKDGIVDIHVEITEEDWASILAEPMAEEYKTAKVTVDGITSENIGFRTKGNSSLKSVARSDSERYSFKININKYIKTQTLLGLDEFVVNNNFSDPSYLREYLSYEALRELGADVPLTTFANVYINGELYGFYLMVESIEDSFLMRNFGDDRGSLYKADQGSNLKYVEGSDYDTLELKSGSDKSKTDLKNFIKILNDMPEGEKGEIENVLDVDSALRYFAVNTVLGNYDSYHGNKSHNYYLYGQDGKFTVLPWDYNMSIAGFGEGDLTTIPIDEPVMREDIKNFPLINNLLAVKEYKERYHKYIEELLDYLEDFEDRVTKLGDKIRPYVEADPTKFYTLEQFEASIAYSETNEAIPMPFQNTRTQSEGEMQRQMPQGERPEMPQEFMYENVPERPQGDQNGDRPERPEFMDGNPPEMQQGDMRGDRPERPQGDMGGGGMMGTSTSIVNFIKARVENIKQQLAGELPTTGNTSMVNIDERSKIN